MGDVLKAFAVSAASVTGLIVGLYVGATIVSKVSKNKHTPD